MPTQEFLDTAEKHIRLTLQELRSILLKAHGSIEHSLKDDKSVVTQMDLLVERKLHDVLQEVDPAIGFSGEETGVDYEQETFWLVDPIDGTESFIRGLPFSTNMIALIHKGEPIMSIIYNFFLDEYYLAIKGQGATCNGHQIHVSNRTLENSYIIFGGRVSKAGLIGLNDQLRDLVKGMPKMNSSGYEFSAIARGAIDGCIIWHRNGHPWDFAPGLLLIKEAGGHVQTIGQEDADYRKTQFVFANPVIFDDLMNFITRAMASA